MFEVLGSLDKQVIPSFSVILGVFCDIIWDKSSSIQANLPNRDVAPLFEVLGSLDRQIIPSFSVIQGVFM